VSNLKDELDKIALSLASAIQQEECPLDAKLDAFKALTAYHLGLLRKNASQPAETDTKSFRAIVENIRKAG
jgi:hypothetical protein